MLQGVSFEVAAGEKVGIVGRTGSGKSSLIVTLFRIVETDGGSITLDGLDLQSMGLNDVRGRIAAIPQDPILFSGTVRSNLDPYGRYEDHEIWDALSHVALKVQHMCQGPASIDRGLHVWSLYGAFAHARKPLDTLMPGKASVFEDAWFGRNRSA